MTILSTGTFEGELLYCEVVAPGDQKFFIPVRVDRIVQRDNIKRPNCTALECTPIGGDTVLFLSLNQLSRAR